MAVIQKTLFSKNLTNYSVLVNDTQPDSKYFKITELPDTFTGGKNAFLIAGSEYLVPDTKIQIELRDASGNIIYHEPGEGMINTNISGSTNTSIITEYYEGVSKVVAVYVYPDTAYGPCTLTILGELSSYESDGGITSIVPLDWENKYNVKWQKQINVNPNLANTTKIRFYQRPQVSITEILSPIYRIESGSKVDSGTNQSFADIKLSKLETFAGDVKRVKVFRTSEGDISDYDLIQDILVESKELLISYGLSGSVVGETGILTSETLKNYWNTGSLNAFLTSSRVESGVRLTGSGYFTYTSSLDIKSTNVYELNLDAYYSASISTNLGIYLVSGSTSSSIGTLIGTAPTKNLLDTVIPFKVDKDFVSASLYFSQSQGEWHLGNISLKLSQDTAFSPDEISFVTTMPTVIGNETYNFKFEFYDVNNNYVPVAVTQSANFTGGTNTSSTTLLISASLSQSLAALAAVSSSISGTMTTYSSSASSSISTLSGSIANELILTSGSIILLSGSFLQFTQSVSSSLNSLSQSVSSSIGLLSSSISSSFSNASSQSAFQVYSASQYLDKFIFTDENGKINQTPTASSPGLYLGSDHLGYFSGSSWKTYMDNQGDFYLTGSTNNFLAWSSQLGTLQVQGVINIQGGNAVTTSSLNSATSSLLGSINSATASLSSSLAPNIFTDSTGKINRPPTVLVNSSEGLFLGSTNLGYYSGSDWKTYMANNGNFYLSGAGSDSLTWAGGVLSINGAINITGGNAATTTNVSNAVISGSNAATNAATSGSNAATNAVTSGSLFAANAAASASLSASAVDAKVFTNSSGLINKTPSTTASGLYLGQTFLGYYNGSDWKTYMSNTGNFFLSGAGSDSLSWSNGVLTINGAINITGGNAATTTNVSNAVTSGSAAATNAVTSGSNAATNAATSGSSAAARAVTSGSLFAANAAASASLSASAVDDKVFTNALGRITKVPTSGSTAGLYLGSTNLGYYNGTSWRTYMDNTGLFYLTGSNNGNALLWDGNALTIKGTIKVSDGTEVTNATVTGAASGSTSLQSGNTGKSLGLTGGSVGGVTIAPTKIYVGTGTYGDVNTGFYVDSSGNMSLKDKLTWDNANSTLSITGTVVITAGATKTAIDNAASVANAATASAASAQNTADSKITGGQVNANVTSISGGSITTGTVAANRIDVAGIITAGSIIVTGGAAGDVNSGVTKIIGGKIEANSISASHISALNFIGKTATFDNGTIGGWTINGTSGLTKVTAPYTLNLAASAQRISITEASIIDTIDRVIIDASTTIPAVNISSTGSLYWSNSGQGVVNVTDNSSPTNASYSTGYVTPNGSPSHAAVSGVYGIIGLIYGEENIFVEAENFPVVENVIQGFNTGDDGSYSYGQWDCSIRVRRFPTDTDAVNETNVDVTFGINGVIEQPLAIREVTEFPNYPQYNVDSTEIYGCSIPVKGGGGFSSQGPPKWYRVEIIQNWYIEGYLDGPNGSFSVTGRRPSSDIYVKFGAVNNGYSIFAPAGLQTFIGVRNYMNVSAPSGSTGDASNFFLVKGKSQIIGSLNVSSGFSAGFKNFKIQHPLNENKWLYHTSTESPRADLIYRGTLQLQSGVGSTSIDSASNMTIGTFDVLTKNPQLFLQNNESFDKIKGYVESGSVYVLSENENASASIDWSVIAERKDTAMLKSPLYDRNGKYKTESYKGEYLQLPRSERIINITGSI